MIPTFNENQFPILNNENVVELKKWMKKINRVLKDSKIIFFSFISSHEKLKALLEDDDIEISETYEFQDFPNSEPSNGTIFTVDINLDDAYNEFSLQFRSDNVVILNKTK